jgi:hypothetical protein
MNSHLADSSLNQGHTPSTRLGRFSRRLALLGLLLIGAGALSGCVQLKQYSIESWDGPLPMSDLRYVQSAK